MANKRHWLFSASERPKEFVSILFVVSCSKGAIHKSLHHKFLTSSLLAITAMPLKIISNHHYYQLLALQIAHRVIFEWHEWWRYLWMTLRELVIVTYVSEFTLGTRQIPLKDLFWKTSNQRQLPSFFPFGNREVVKPNFQAVLWALQV